ncbi:MAG: ABC transporter substrate-binding protein, partial [Paucibacter sp.]|nr:ABC transporter substrate-binding protein [Roseateles sp.]
MSHLPRPTSSPLARPAAVRRALIGLSLAMAGAAAGLPAWAATEAGAAEGKAAAPSTASASPKVLRYAFRVAETGFDPAQISDTYSKTVAAGIFDAPLKFEYLAKPAKLVPNTVVAMPEISADFKTLTFEVKPGVYFNDDPAFKSLKPGEKRELTAADYIYSIKRHYDPQWKSPNLYLLENVKILGLSELRKELMAAKKPFDYDRPVEGLQQLSRYKFQIKLGVGDPRFINQFADSGFLGAVAREVVEAYSDKIMEHPVGTGAWRLAEWRRSSRIVLEKNPNYREEFYQEQPPADKPELAAQVKALQGRRLPMIDRVEIAIIEENQPRWLSFLGNEAELLPELPFEFAGIAIPNNKLAPNLAKKGVQMTRFIYPEIAFSYFNMEDPVVGGYTPEKIALRRAISLGMDVNKQIRIARRGQGIPAQGPSIPGVFGYDP